MLLVQEYLHIYRLELLMEYLLKDQYLQEYHYYLQRLLHLLQRYLLADPCARRRFQSAVGKAFQ